MATYVSPVSGLAGGGVKAIAMHILYAQLSNVYMFQKRVSKLSGCKVSYS